MQERSDILRIVKEDLLRILNERRKKKVSLKSLETEIKVSSSFISNAIEDLKKENLIRAEKDSLSLTKTGRESANNILRKHLVLENYFRRSLNEEEAHRKAHILEHYISEEVINDLKKISTLKEREIPLTELKLNEEKLIADITISNNDLFERVVSMGIFPGERIMLTNRISDCVVIKVKNKKFVLDRRIAREIKVVKRSATPRLKSGVSLGEFYEET